jgi:formylglycine-generating enzyme required for sulfatase activity
MRYRPSSTFLALAILCAASRSGASSESHATVQRSPIANSLGMKFMWAPPGDAHIGSPASEPGRSDDETRRAVRVVRGFYIGVHEVTQAQFAEVMGRNPSAFSARGDRRQFIEGMDTANFPVESIAWNDAIEFCRRLGQRPAEQRARHTYRLPTEMEWEYACRAGEQRSWSFGNDPAKLADYAWFGRHAVGNRPYAVGMKRPNRWGLHDMHGNVWEWCADVTMSDEHARIIRGGSWFSPAANTRSAARRDDPATITDPDTGFRVVLEVAAD